MFPMAVDPTPVFWNRIRDELVLRLPSRQAFDTWFEPVSPRRVNEQRLELDVPSLFLADWIQQHYLEVLAESARAVLGAAPELRFFVRPELALVTSGAPDAAGADPEAQSNGHHAPPPSPPRILVGDSGAFGGSLSDSGLIPRYTFSTFVVGASNHMSHAAALAVGEGPGARYNPLVIYGGVGLGKTHLMHAIGHRILEDRP